MSSRLLRVERRLLLRDLLRKCGIGEGAGRGVLLELLALRGVGKRAGAERLRVALLLRRVLEGGLLRRHLVEVHLLLATLRDRGEARVVASAG